MFVLVLVGRGIRNRTTMLDRGTSVSKVIEKLLISSVSKILNFAPMLPAQILSSTIFSSQVLLPPPPPVPGAVVVALAVVEVVSPTSLPWKIDA